MTRKCDISLWCALAAVILLGAGLLFCGTVDIPAADVLAALTGRAGADSTVSAIVWQLRVPAVFTSLAAGVALSVAGLLLQTTFDNPLAGPSILGVSTGASLGVAVLMLAMGGAAGAGWYFGTIAGAVIGAAGVMVLLLLFSTVVKSHTMLLIVGILISYLASAAISLLNFYSTTQGVHSYVIWGLGSFWGLTPERTWVFCTAAGVATVASLLFIKPLNAMLLGDTYARSMGVSLRATRNWLYVVSGLLTALVTAFCGPIGFLGLVVPHIARLTTGTSNHARLLPATIVWGAATGLLCSFLSVACGRGSVIPVNAITPVISIPVIIYVIINRDRLSYFR